MKRRIVGAAALGACLVLAFLFVGWCRSLGPDVEGAKREVERVIPEHIQMTLADEGVCSPPDVGGCVLLWTLVGDPREYVADARTIRDNLVAKEWTEQQYAEREVNAGGTFTKDGMRISFRMRSPLGIANCLSSLACPSNISVEP
jgi:hypothetical protein